MHFLKITLLSVFLCGSGILMAQETYEKLSLNEMISLALERNPEYRNADLYIEKSEFSRKTAWELGETTLDWTHGQINTLKTDNHYLIMQDLGSPATHATLSRMMNQQIQYYRLRKFRTEKEIRRDLAVTYNNWLYFNTIDGITVQTLEYVKKAADYSRLQYKAGESNQLSQLLMETKFLDMESYRKSLSNRKYELDNELMKLTFSGSKIIPSDSLLAIREDSSLFAIKDSVPYNSPDLALYSQVVNLAKSNIGYQRSQLSPSFKAGYFNQQIDGIRGFDGWQLGIGIPLWFFPQRSRIQIARVEKSIAENDYRMQKASTEYDITALYNQLQLLNERIEFYQNRMLANAAIIESNALQMYQSGEIGYIEYIQNILTANKSREDFWTLVKEHNQIIYQLEYFLNE